MTIYRDKAIGAGRLNDRLNLVLLKYKAKRRWIEDIQLRRCERLYPDNQTFEDGLIEILDERRLIYKVNAETELDENNDPYKIRGDLPEYWQTTPNGEMALKNRLFPSESAKESFDARFRLFQVIGICIAALGGLITLFTFLYKQLVSFFQ